MNFAEHQHASSRKSATPPIKAVWLDDQLDRLAYQITNLSINGVAVLCARDPMAAMKLLREHLPNIAIVDLVLKGEANGFDFIREAMFAYPDMAVVLLTAYPDDASHKLPEDLKQLPILSKPDILVLKDVYERSNFVAQIEKLARLPRTPGATSEDMMATSFPRLKTTPLFAWSSLKPFLGSGTSTLIAALPLIMGATEIAQLTTFGPSQLLTKLYLYLGGYAGLVPAWILYQSIVPREIKNHNDEISFFSAERTALIQPERYEHVKQLILASGATPANSQFLNAIAFFRLKDKSKPVARWLAACLLAAGAGALIFVSVWRLSEIITRALG